jgi:hypothetical protein
MRASARLRDGGAPLRAAMAGHGWGYAALAAHTRTIDPQGLGVSWQTVASIATQQPRWRRDGTRPRTGQLIEDALGVPRGTLFDYVDDLAATLAERETRQPEWEAL